MEYLTNSSKYFYILHWTSKWNYGKHKNRMLTVCRWNLGIECWLVEVHLGTNSTCCCASYLWRTGHGSDFRRATKVENRLKEFVVSSIFFWTGKRAIDVFKGLHPEIIHDWQTIKTKINNTKRLRQQRYADIKASIRLDRMCGGASPCDKLERYQS